MPYDPTTSITKQVSASVKSSLHNLRHNESDASTSYLDCLVLHSPLPSLQETQEAWRAMEDHVPDQTRTLGISNVYQIEVLKALYDSARVKPSVVQNRFFANTGYDGEIRAFCTEKGMVSHPTHRLNSKSSYHLFHPCANKFRSTNPSGP